MVELPAATWSSPASRPSSRLRNSPLEPVQALDQRPGQFVQSWPFAGEGQPAADSARTGGTPSSRSSACNCRVTAGWLRNSASAARDTDPSRADLAERAQRLEAVALVVESRGGVASSSACANAYYISSANTNRIDKHLFCQISALARLWLERIRMLEPDRSPMALASRARQASDTANRRQVACRRRTPSGPGETCCTPGGAGLPGPSLHRALRTRAPGAPGRPPRARRPASTPASCPTSAPTPAPSAKATGRVAAAAGRPAGPPRRDHRSGRPEDGHQRAELRRQGASWPTSRTRPRRPGPTCSHGQQHAARARSPARSDWHGAGRAASTTRSSPDDQRRADRASARLAPRRKARAGRRRAASSGSLFDLGLFALPQRRRAGRARTAAPTSTCPSCSRWKKRRCGTTVLAHHRSRARPAARPDEGRPC